MMNCFILNSQELTGTLPSDYPLMPDEKPPRVRRRIGASFKLDEGLIHLDKRVQTTINVYSVWGNKQKRLSIHRLKLNIRTCVCHRIQSCKHWKLTWLSSGRFMRRPANSPWKRTSVNHRRRAGCSSARGRRRKWRICRRPCSSTGSRASVTHHASTCQKVKTKVSDCAAAYRPNSALQSWAHKVGLMGLMDASEMFVLCVQIYACLMTAPCLTWWLWMMVSKYSIKLPSLFYS